MEDIIVTSVKKIIADANLPLVIKFSNDKTDVIEYKAMFGGEFPVGSTEVDLVNRDTGIAFETSIVGLTFDDYQKNSYVVTAYNGFTATLNTPLLTDMLEGDVVDLKSGDELKLIQLPSTFDLNKGTITNKLRYRVKGFDVYLTLFNDSNGDKAEEFSRKVGKIFSNQAYPCYDTLGNKTGEHFNIELNLNFTDISTVATTKVLLSRLRFGKYECFNKL